MSTIEHLLLLQREQGIEVGDTVKVYPFPSHINGNPYFSRYMEGVKEGVVLEVGKKGTYSVRSGVNSWYWPATHVILLAKKKVKRSVTLNAEYSADVYADKVVVGCQTIHIERIRDILAVATDLGKKS